jgi:hypothetical protein
MSFLPEINPPNVASHAPDTPGDIPPLPTPAHPTLEKDACASQTASLSEPLSMTPYHPGSNRAAEADDHEGQRNHSARVRPLLQPQLVHIALLARVAVHMRPLAHLEDRRRHCRSRRRDRLGACVAAAAVDAVLGAVRDILGTSQLELYTGQLIGRRTVDEFLWNSSS